MKIRTLFLVGLAVMAISTTITAEQTSKKKTVAKGWKPAAYALDAERLPVGYTGVDPKKFFQMFKSKLAVLKKDEFETSDEFAIRSANVDSILAPINTSDLYAFRITGIPVKYDADNQAYSFGDKFGYECKDTSSRILVICNVGFSTTQDDTYRGTNAYGASIDVSRVRGVKFALAIHSDAPVLNSHFRIISSSRLMYHTYLDMLPIPLEKARTLKDETKAVLFVGHITDAKLVEGVSLIEKPTIDSPSDSFITVDAVRFTLKKIIYYVVETGEILKQQDF